MYYQGEAFLSVPSLTLVRKQKVAIPLEQGQIQERDSRMKKLKLIEETEVKKLTDITIFSFSTSKFGRDGLSYNKPNYYTRRLPVVNGECFYSVTCTLGDTQKHPT